MPREQQDQQTPQKTQSKSRTYLLCGFIVILAAVLFFLPTILVNTPLKRTAINWATSDLAGTVEMDSISAGWLTPIEINQTVLRDEQGNEVLSVAKIKTDQTLLGILSGNYGNLTIEQPALDLKLRPDGSNLEDVLASFTNSQPETSSSDLPPINVVITDAMVRLQSELLPNSTVIENVNAQFKIAGEAAAVNGAITIGNPNLTTPSLDAKITLDPGQKQILGQSFELVADTEKLQLADFAPVLTRIIGPANMAGIVDGSINVQYTKDNSDIEFTNFQTNQLAFLAPTLIGQDQFSAQKITTAGRISANPQHIFADNFKLESEFARVSANGDFDLQQLSKLTAGDQLPDSRFQIDGVVDLAQITKMLPETTRIREGVQMNSGLLQMTATARKENGSPRLVFNADAANMDFVVDGRKIHWNKPLRAVAVTGSRDGQIFLEDIRLASEFLSAAGHATLTSGKINLSGDLAKVMNQVGQVIDTGDVVLAGIANGQVQWQTNSDSTSAPASETPIPIQIVGNIDVKNPKIQLPGFQPWQDKSVQLTIDSTARVSTTDTTAIESAIINSQIGNETFSATLAQPIADLANHPRWQFNCAADGSVARWIAHARNFTTFPAFFCDGNLQSKFLLTAGPQAIRLNQVQFTSQDFGFDGFALNIREPKVTGRGNIKYDLATGKIEFTKARISSAAFAGNADSIQLDLSRKILVDGTLNFRADANRASNWIGFSMPNDSVRWDGDVTGTMNFSSDSDAFAGQLTAKVADMVFVQPVATTATVAANQSNASNQLVSNKRNYTEIWSEPDLNLSTNISLSDDFNNLRLDGLTLHSKTADANIAGTINNLADDMVADLKGRWRVDWQAVNQTVKELAGDVVQFRGDQWQPIHIQGPLYSSEDYQWIPHQLAAVAKLQWQQANIYNIPLGTNQIDVRIDQSLANLSTTANNNILDRVFGMQPVVDLRRADPIVYLREGNLLDQWAISAEDSRTWLKYVAPLIADTTSANGSVSANLKGAAIPIFDPATASAQGTINVHQLTVGAGPLVQQLIPLIDQIRTALKPGANSLKEKTNWLQLRPQQLPFTVQNGRVHHSDFEMKYKDVIVQTSGSVGFDQTVDMVAKIPINEDWVSGNKTLSQLAGKSISIPIGGNLSRPQMDRRAVTQLVSNLLRETALGAAQEKVGEEVGKLQNKLNTKVQDGMNEFQQKLNNKFKSEVEDKLQNELQNGFKKLFGGGKK